MTYTKDTIVFAPKPTNPRFKDIDGQRFGYWAVLGFAGHVSFPSGTTRCLWFCECVCGEIRKLGGSELRTSHSRSCGCAYRRPTDHHFIHGATVGDKATPEYRACQAAKSRCTNPNNADYYLYGGRGIQFNFDSFQDFFNHIGPRPTPEHSLDRWPNNNGHYERGNVRWATKLEQSRNRRCSWHFTVNGVTRSLTEWSSLTGRAVKTIANRRRLGWCDQCAVTNSFHRKCPHH